jgi:hypothetical protein
MCGGWWVLVCVMAAGCCCVLWLVDAIACDVWYRFVRCGVQVGVELKGARACDGGYCVQLCVVLGADECGA